MANEWNTSIPVDHTLISDLPGEHRAIKTNTAAVIEKEHQTLGDGNSGGEHKQGSGISYFLATASAPTTRPDGATALTIDDAGRLWFDTTTHELKVLISVGPLVWKIIPSTAAAIALLSTLDVAGDFSVATNKATIAAASGNTALAGTLDVTGLTELIGVATIADDSVTKTAAVADAAAKIANLATVDAQIAASADPAYTGGESHIFGGGLIIKSGFSTGTGAGDKTITFGGVGTENPFPNAIVSVVATIYDTSGSGGTSHLVVKAYSVDSFTVDERESGSDGTLWIAIGY